MSNDAPLRSVDELAAAVEWNGLTWWLRVSPQEFQAITTAVMNPGSGGIGEQWTYDMRQALAATHTAFGWGVAVAPNIEIRIAFPPHTAHGTTGATDGSGGPDEHG